MADTEISNLPEAATPSADDEFAVDQGSSDRVTRKQDMDTIRDDVRTHESPIEIDGEWKLEHNSSEGALDILSI